MFMCMSVSVYMYAYACRSEDQDKKNGEEEGGDHLFKVWSLGNFFASAEISRKLDVYVCVCVYNCRLVAVYPKPRSFAIPPLNYNFCDQHPNLRLICFVHPPSEV
jgi:hypothetical protein